MNNAYGFHDNPVHFMMAGISVRSFSINHDAAKIGLDVWPGMLFQNSAAFQKREYYRAREIIFAAHYIIKKNAVTVGANSYCHVA